MYNYKLMISYDGTRYQGWQRQLINTEQTIQGKIENVLSKFFDMPIQIIGSGRTDAGVHAKGQIANFHTETYKEPEAILAYCLEYLPHDIAVIKVQKCSERFHARYNAIGKTYSYTLDLAKVPSPFTLRYSTSITEVLDFDAMKEASSFLIGTHDFKSFTSLKSKKKSTTKTLSSVDFSLEGTYLKIYYSGDGFLQHMVRILTGTLIEVGLKQKSAQDIPLILEKKTRALAGFTAPSHGLCLEVVHYD